MADTQLKSLNVMIWTIISRGGNRNVHLVYPNPCEKAIREYLNSIGEYDVIIRENSDGFPVVENVSGQSDEWFQEFKETVLKYKN